MSFKIARAALAQFVSENWPTDTPMFYENGPVPNLVEIATPFATFEVDLQDSRQAELASNPLNRYWGVAYFTFFQQEGTGTDYLSDGFDWITANLANKRFGICQCQTPAPVRAPDIDGWYGKTIQLPFFYHA